MDWKSAVHAAVSRLCRRKGSATFSVTELYEEELAHIIRDVQPAAPTPKAILRFYLRKLRDDGVIEFVDYRGTYRLLRYYR